MAYYQKYRRRRRRQYRKRPMRRQIYGAAASQLWKDVKLLKDIVNVEYKRVELASGATYPSSSGELLDWSQIAQGDSAGQREGNSVKLQRLVVRGTVLKNASATNTRCRIIVFHDKDDTVSAVTDVLDGTAVATVNAPMATKNYDNRFKTKILYDKMMLLDTYNISRTFKINIPLNFHAMYDSTGATDHSKGVLRCIMITNETGANYPTVTYFGHVSYTDN